VLKAQDLTVPPSHDPRDPDQPPIHVAFANTAELVRGAQMALVGGIGSGKTTELQLTLKLLKRHADAVNVYVDLAELTDLSALNPGAILIAIGSKLYSKLKEVDRNSADMKSAHAKLRELGVGKTAWVEPDQDDYEPDLDDQPPLVPIQTPGLLKPRFPAMQRKVLEVRNLLLDISKPLLDADAQITVLIDGLDRLIQPERFREFAEQDLRALRGVKISLIVAAPLLLWFDKSRFVQDYFNDVKHIPAAVSDPEESDFLYQVLLRRGAKDVMDEDEISEIARFSGGVLRDLITLARTSAEAAYRDDKDRIDVTHVRSAVRQLGKRYLMGLGNVQRRSIKRLTDNNEFSTEDPIARKLLVDRHVLEYVDNQRDRFAVHPALAEVLTESA
jgi:Cdc6-like AAA superfamily ATPase